ncbi:pre-mRNA processing factor 3-domain-containing protein [Mortierella sp. GBAus27b]|nr:hypothetical protein BGX31_002723 [Mortierella sp. GBA43]KAI8353592.1 pre-mRNA processing factor 3-domain-containing protein [Mortierella sp. GBAus27b]
MTPEEIKAMVATAKARAQARALALKAQQPGQPPTAAPAPAPTPTPPTPASVPASTTAPVSSGMPTPTLPAAPAPAADPRARGGLGVDLSSMISRDEHGNLVINAVTSGKTVKAPSFATAKINQKPEPKKELKILDVPDELINPEKNPYYDPNLSSAPKERKARPLKFAPKGKFKSIGNQIRAEQRIEQLRKEIEQGGMANVQEEDLQVKDGFTKRDVLKDGVEWWDAAFLPNKTYEDITNGNAKIDTEDSLITHYIQHPVPIEPPNEAARAANAKPRPLMLTTKERKKLRRQRRRELLKEKQDKVRLGLLPPDAPKVKLANMMRVLGQEAVLNPTEVEMKVREQVAARLQGHLDMNAERKLTHDERKAKEQKRKDEDIAKGIHVSLYRINDLSHPQKKFKVDKNAQQLGLTGMVLLYPTFTMVVVEGGQKSITQYKKLMLRRIDWTDNTRLDGTDATSESTIDNKCLLVWEGQLRERQFKKFQFIKARTEAQLKEILARFGIQHYWDQALGFREDDMLGAQVTL